MCASFVSLGWIHAHPHSTLSIYQMYDMNTVGFVDASTENKFVHFFSSSTAKQYAIKNVSTENLLTEIVMLTLLHAHNKIKSSFILLPTDTNTRNEVTLDFLWFMKHFVFSLTQKSLCWNNDERFFFPLRWMRQETFDSIHDVLNAAADDDDDDVCIGRWLRIQYNLCVKPAGWWL